MLIWCFNLKIISACIVVGAIILKLPILNLFLPMMQHLLERGKSYERSQIINKLAGQIVQLSQHKFASNVIEKCLEFGDVAERDLLIGEIVGQTEGNDNLLVGIVLCSFIQM